MSKKPIWIAAIARGHNSGVCLLKDGEVVSNKVGAAPKTALKTWIEDAI